MRGVIQIRALLAAALAGLLLAGTPAARADDLPQAPVSAQDIVTQAVAAATAPTAPEPAPAPEQPAAAPASAPPEEPAAAATVTPAEPSEPVAAPKAPAAPANVNVSVRVGSEGDDGPVHQASEGTNVSISVRVDSPGASAIVEQATSGARPAPTASPEAPAAAPAKQVDDLAGPAFVWHWTWTSACGFSAPGAAPRAAVELDWHWSCDAPVAAPGAPAVPALPALPPGAVPGAVPVLAAAVVPAATFPLFGTTAPPAATAVPGVAVAAPTLMPALRDLGPSTLLAPGATATVPALLTGRPLSAPAGAAAPRRSQRDRDPGARRPDPAPISPEIPLPPIALVTTSPAGSSAAGIVFLLALALLGGAALSGPSGPRLRLCAATNRLRARVGRRLERPG